MADSDEATEGGIRRRFRSQIRGEVKEAALRQLSEGGPQALSINAIAKELGVSGPALYRYFASRDDLLTELVTDAYHDFAVALEAGTPPAGDVPPADRLRAFAAAYRRWATTEPHRYRLLFAAPLPGYDAQSERLVNASREGMQVLLDVLAPLTPAGDEDGVHPLRGQLQQWSDSRELPGITPRLALRAVTTWSRLHGLASLEIESNFASMGLDPELIFEAEVDALLDSPAQLGRGEPPR
ncbi:TetR/AcrR family transcriptional regulator [Kribbella sp. CA-247076]|uniref:TetR/AcrR family transcriptional regulator n=1 Tax=Kribbella sp. CA-247076 TaxID=3239941 RepID=UPI003D930432